MKTVLITGASRGLGLALAQGLLLGGWRVVTASRSRSAELDALIRAQPDRIEHHPVDFARADDTRAFAAGPAVMGGVDAFIANAAIGTEGLLTLTSEAAIRECVEVNLVAPMLLARQVIKGMIDRGGSLVFVSSVAARTGLAGLSVYTATKGGLVAFSRALAREYGERGIRSNCILPGFLETDMSSTLTLEQRERVRRRTPLGRLGQVNDVIGAVRYLLSDDARFVTGTEVEVDGGFRA